MGLYKEGIKMLCFKEPRISRQFHIKNFVIVGIILLVALAVRLYALDRYSFCYDEASFLVDERGLNQIHSISKLLDGEYLLKNQDYLALYNHSIVYYWQKLVGKSEFLLRLSSVLFSLLSIYMFYVLGEHIFNIKIARIASMLLTISPFHIYYAQELRPYAAVCFFTILAVYSFLKALDTGKKRYWFIYIFSNILNIYFHYMGLLVLFSFCFFFVFNIKKYKFFLKPFVLVHTTIIFLLIPVFLTLYHNVQFFFHNEVYPGMSDFPVWAGKPTLRHLLTTFKNFSIGYNINYYSLGGKLITTFYFSLFLFGVFKVYKKPKGILLLVCLFIPILLLFFISKIKSCYVDRYFFSVFPFYLLGVAIGLSKMNKKAIFISVLIITVFNCLALRNYNLNYLPDEYVQHAGVVERQNIKGLDKFISDNYKIGDRIIHTCRNTVFPLRFYIRQTSPNANLIQEIDRGTVILFNPDIFKEKELFRVDYKELHPTTFLPQEFKAVNNLEKNSRLWVVFSSWHFKGIDSQEYEVIKRIEENFKKDKIEKFDGGFVYLFSKN